jgi:hypothetical protein
MNNPNHLHFKMKNHLIFNINMYSQYLWLFKFITILTFFNFLLMFFILFYTLFFLSKIFIIYLFYKVQR